MKTRSVEDSIFVCEAKIEKLIESTRPLILSTEESPIPPIRTEEEARAIIDSGKKSLPPEYQPAFLDGLENMLNSFQYSDILKMGSPGPWEDWMKAISQRTDSTYADHNRGFEEVISTFYRGVLKNNRRKGIPEPDTEKVVPLAKWGSPRQGPYTVPADQKIFQLGIDIAVVSLPPAYRKNISLWASLAHECSGHDVLGAYTHLLDELDSAVQAAFRDSKIEGTATVSGSATPISEFAAEYWSRCLSETAADVCGLFNIGCAQVLSLATILVTARGGKIATANPANNPHPIDVTRLWIAIELLDRLPSLDSGRVQAWISTIKRIEEKYVSKDDLKLTVSENGKSDVVASVSQEEMRKTIPLLVDAIATSKLKALGGHALIDVHSWNDVDEALSLKYAEQLRNHGHVSIEATDSTTSSTHVLAGAVLAMCSDGANIEQIHGGATESILRIADGVSVESHISK